MEDKLDYSGLLPTPFARARSLPRRINLVPRARFERLCISREGQMWFTAEPRSLSDKINELAIIDLSVLCVCSGRHDAIFKEAARRGSWLNKTLTKLLREANARDLLGPQEYPAHRHARFEELCDDATFLLGLINPLKFEELKRKWRRRLQDQQLRQLRAAERTQQA